VAPDRVWRARVIPMLIRDIEETNWKYGFDPWHRPVEELLEFGIINVDKPKGPTSHQVTSWVKHMLGARKAGHSGTLDPKVTGVLPIAINSATKVVQALLKSGKEYVGVMHLHGDVPLHELKEIVGQFEGEILQVPPVKSSVKRRARKRRVYYFKILEVNGRDVLFRTAVQAGTYIRKLCHDIGVALGIGAHMRELRRTRAGPFTERTCVKLHELKEAWEYYRETGNDELLRKVIRPVEDAVALLPKVYIKDSAVNSICYGANLGVGGVSKVEENVKQGELVAVMSLKGELVALGIALMDADEMAKLWEGEAVDIERVIMKKDVYPKTW